MRTGAAALLAALLAAGCEAAPVTTLTPQPSSIFTPIPTSSDPHVVISGDVTYRVALDAQNLLVTASTATGAGELVRLPVPPGANASPAAISWGLTDGALCTPPGSTSDARLVFGHVTVFKSALSTADPFWVGPAADGQVAPDGLFLYVLRPGPVLAGDYVHIYFEGEELAAFGLDAFSKLAHETPGPSGCRVR